MSRAWLGSAIGPSTTTFDLITAIGNFDALGGDLTGTLVMSPAGLEAVAIVSVSLDPYVIETDYELSRWNGQSRADRSGSMVVTRGLHGSTPLAHPRGAWVLGGWAPGASPFLDAAWVRERWPVEFGHWPGPE